MVYGKGYAVEVGMAVQHFTTREWGVVMYLVGGQCAVRVGSGLVVWELSEVVA